MGSLKNPELKFAAIRHRVNSVCGESYHGLLYLSAIGVDRRQLGCDLNADIDVVSAFLMRDEIGRRTHYIAKIDRGAFAGSYTAKVEQAGGDGLASKGFAFDQPQVLSEIVGSV